MAVLSYSRQSPFGADAKDQEADQEAMERDSEILDGLDLAPNYQGTLNRIMILDLSSAKRTALTIIVPLARRTTNFAS